MGKLKSLFSDLKTEILDIWQKSKMYVLAGLALLIAFEFRKLKEYLLVRAGAQEIKKDTKEDAILADKEKDANTQADALVKQAEQLPTEEKPVGDDWNQK